MFTKKMKIIMAAAVLLGVATMRADKVTVINNTDFTVYIAFYQLHFKNGADLVGVGKIAPKTAGTFNRGEAEFLPKGDRTWRHWYYDREVEVAFLPEFPQHYSADDFVKDRMKRANIGRKYGSTFEIEEVDANLRIFSVLAEKVSTLLTKGIVFVGDLAVSQADEQLNTYRATQEKVKADQEQLKKDKAKLKQDEIEAAQAADLLRIHNSASNNKPSDPGLSDDDIAATIRSLQKAGVYDDNKASSSSQRPLYPVMDRQEGAAHRDSHGCGPDEIWSVVRQRCVDWSDNSDEQALAPAA
jgi:hypothetical protein